MIQVKSFSTFISFNYFFVLFLNRPKLIIKVSNVDVGPRRLAALRPYERRHPAVAVPPPWDESTETLAKLENHLESLTTDIRETSIDDIPLRLQRYVIGVPGPFRRFLCRVARAVVSYHDHH